MTENHLAVLELGGEARAAKMTPEERFESARKAARARWAKKRQKDDTSS